ncbi:MAG: hypothetical protein H7A46_26115 [Verrucomicrobiales bacterium]|nr:hypothetical protein [Verrucomicrobiales bacterium]
MAVGWEIVTDWLSVVLFFLGRLVEAWNTFAFRLKLNIGAIIIALTGLGEVFDLVLDRKFARAAGRMKEVMADLAKATANLTADAAKDLKAFGTAFAETGEYAAEVAVESGRKWDAAVVSAGQRLLTLDEADDAGMAPFEPPPQPAPVVIESETVIRQRTKLQLEQQAQALADARLNLSARAARIENDRSLSDTQRYRQTLSLRRTELSLLDDYISRLKERSEIEQDEATRQLIASQLRSAERERVGLDTQVINLQGRGDPSSMTAQLFIAADDIARRIGTLAQQVARSFTDLVGSAIDGIAGSIEGLINRTMSWADALKNIGNTVVKSLIASFARMAAEFVMQQVIMRGAMLVTSALMTALGVKRKAENTTQFVSGATAGVGQAGAQGGWVGILIYLAVLGAAIAAVAGMAGAFAKGGLVTGPGGPKSDSVLARLSAGEYVLNADAVRHYGQPTLEAMNRRILTVHEAQAAPQPVVPGMPPAAPMPAPEAARQALNLVLVDRRNQAREFLESSEGEARILDIIRRRRLEIG